MTCKYGERLLGRSALVYLDVIPLVAVTTLAKQAVGDGFVDVKLIEHRIGVL